MIKSAVESTEDEVRRDVPTFIDAMQYDTLRYRYHATRRDRRDKPAKAIVDVSKVVEEDFEEGGNPHRPLVRICPDIWMEFDKFPLAAYHYLGSWQSYSAREYDARNEVMRSYDKWANQSLLASGGPDDYIRAWITGFANLVGEENAKFLLEDAGQPSTFLPHE